MMQLLCSHAVNRQSSDSHHFSCNLQSAVNNINLGQPNDNSNEQMFSSTGITLGLINIQGIYNDPILKNIEKKNHYHLVGKLRIVISLSQL